MTPANATPAAFRIHQVLTVVLLLSLTCAHAAAQTPDADTDTNAQLGPLGLNPRISWQSEYDDNVYRTAAAPVSDISSTFGGSTTFRGQMRRLDISGGGSASWVHYATLIEERGANFGTNLKLELQMNRIVPYVIGSYENTRQRVNPEIDTRPRTKHSTVTAGGKIRFASKTALDVSAGRSNIEYDKVAVTNGVNVARALNHDSSFLTLSLFQDVTTQARVVMTGEMRRNEFDSSEFRNADELRLTAGFTSEGRIRGSVQGGYRIHKPQDVNEVESRGFVISAGTTATVRDRLQIGLNADRDLAPSYRPDVAYYDSYGYDVTMTYAMLHSVRLQGFVGRRHSDYRDSGAVFAEEMGIDIEMKYGAGFNYRLGESMLFDFSGGHVQRTSAMATRRFDGLIFKVGVSHAF